MLPDPVTAGIVTAGALQVAKQAQDFLAAASGHPGESIGTILGNIGKRRLANAECVSNKAHLILLNIGEEAREVPLPILYPALEAASLQEDSYLQDTWANLLANAANPGQNAPVMPAFATILKELTGREVKFLHALVERASAQTAEMTHGEIQESMYTRNEMFAIYSAAGLCQAKMAFTSEMSDEEYQEHRPDLITDANNFSITFQVILRNGIVAERMRPYLPTENSIVTMSGRPDDIQVELKHSLTYFGASFVKACRDPALPALVFSRDCFDERP